MRGLSSRVVKLEGESPKAPETVWAMVRWRHPNPGPSGFVAARPWGWDLRDRLGWGAPADLVGFVTNENASPEPEVLIPPKPPAAMSEEEDALLATAIDEAGPWWMITIRGAFVDGNAIPRGLSAFIEEGMAKYDEEPGNGR